MSENKSYGAWGEKIVHDYLVTQGYAIIAQNWRLHHYEIDIVASRGDVIAFVEVKTRRDGTNPLDAITPRKIRNMGAAANAYMQTQRLPLNPRFDVAAVMGTPQSYKLEYIANAFRPQLRTYH